MHEDLLQEIEDNNIDIVEKPLRGNLKGLYSDNIIALGDQIKTNTERTCVLAEELGHYYTSAGDILDQSTIENRKQEYKARRWAVKRLVRVEDIIEAFNAGVSTRSELAECLNITEKFLYIAIDHFKGIYGQFTELNEYVICFDPLYVCKRITK